MPRQDYPSLYVNQARVDASVLDESFADWVLSTRLWVMRWLVIAAAGVAIWRNAHGLPPYSATLLTSLPINISLFLSVLSAIKWPQGYPLQVYWIRLCLCLLLLLSGLHLVSSAGFTALWAFSLMMIGTIIFLDEPSDRHPLRQWLGSLIALLAMLAALGLIASDPIEDQLLLFKRWCFMLGIVLVVTLYAWHYIFFFHKYLKASTTFSDLGWQKRVALIVEQFESVNPLLIILMLAMLVVNSGLTALFVPWESSLLVEIARLQSPLVFMLLGLMAMTFMLVVKPKRSRWFAHIAFWLLASFPVWIMTSDAPLDLAMIFVPFLFLQFFQPLNHRWWAILATLLCLMAFFFFNGQVVFVTEAMVVGGVTLVSCVLIFDRLRQGHVKQIQGLKQRLEAANHEVTNAQPHSQDDRPWFDNVHHWYLMGASVILVVSFLGHFSFQFNQKTLAAEWEDSLNSHLVNEQQRLLNEMHLLFLAGPNAKINESYLGSENFCGVWASSNDTVLSVVADRCSQQIDKAILTRMSNMPIHRWGFLIQNDKPLFIVASAVDDDLALYGRINLEHWFGQIVPNANLLDSFNMSLWLDNGSPVNLGTLDVLSRTLLMNESHLLVPVYGSQLRIVLSTKSETLQYFWLGLSQMLLVIILLLVLLRYFYNSRAGYIRVSSALETSENELNLNQELRQELANALHRAEEANRAKDQFLGVIGHEIRTPLNSVMGMLQALSLQSLPDAAKGLVRNAYSGSHMLLNLVNDVLDFAKIQSGTMSLYERPFSIGHLVNLYYQQYLPSTQVKGLSFKCQLRGDKHAILVGDELRLGQILGNFLSNALKFTSAGGIIFQVDVEGDEKTKRCTFQVIDSGPGIDQKHLQKLFEPFVQLDMSIKREHRGAGLGLSIAKRLASLMGGRIDVHSRLGKGSTFVLTVDLKVSDDATIQPQLSSLDFKPPEAIYRGVRILVVDDDELNLDVIRELLEPYGVEVDCAQDAQQSLAFVAQHAHEYAFVLMDHQMPDMTGLEQTYLLRETYNKDVLPVVILTADLSEKVVQLAEKAGCNKAIAKPVKLKILLELLDTYRR